MPRSVPEWIGKTPDTPVPDRVATRVFDKYGGRDYRTGVKLRPGHWHCDHVIALINGGENRESNLAPIETEEHKVKTVEDIKIKSKTYRMRKKDIGLKSRTSRPMPGSRDSEWYKPMRGKAERRT